MPGKIIILRHGEKANPFALCSIGVRRSLALVKKYLGQGAEESLFEGGEPPNAFFAITLHTIELASPAAQSWNLPVIAYSAVPINNSATGDSPDVLNVRTQKAAADALDLARAGRTVVMVWEHKRIASKDLEAQYPHAVTLRQHLNLSKFDDDPKNRVPGKWEGENYNFFWVITFGADGQPAGFEMKKQEFGGDFGDLPQNDWGEAAPALPGSDCES